MRSVKDSEIDVNTDLLSNYMCQSVTKELQFSYAEKERTLFLYCPLQDKQGIKYTRDKLNFLFSQLSFQEKLHQPGPQGMWQSSLFTFSLDQKEAILGIGIITPLYILRFCSVKPNFSTCPNLHFKLKTDTCLSLHTTWHPKLKNHSCAAEVAVFEGWFNHRRSALMH